MLKRIAIAIVVAAALALTWRMLGERERQASRSARVSSSLPTFDDRAVKAMTLETGGAPWRLEREGNGWAFTAPMHDTANAAAVADLLGAARTSPILQSIDAADDPASFGLAPPVASITFDGGDVPRLEVGKTTPTGEGIFLRVAGRPGILVVGLPQSEPFRHLTMDSFRDPSWMGVTQSEVTEIEIGREGGLRVEKRPDGWWVVAPRGLPAADDQVGRLLGILSGARVVAIDDTGDPGDSRYGLGSGATRFVLRAGNTRRELTLGGPAGEGRRFATSDARKTILVVSGKGLEAIPSDAESLRDRRLTKLNRYAVVRAAYEGKGKRFAVARVDETTWKTDGGGPVPAADVYALLAGLLSARTSRLEERAPKGAPEATLTYTLDDGTSGRIDVFAGGAVTWGGLPGVTAILEAPAPAIPDQK